MTANLFAACKHNGNLVARRIRLIADIQSTVSNMFLEQEREFKSNKEELEFNGGWKPEEHEIFTIDIPQEAEIFEEAIRANANSIQDIDVKNFGEEGIKAIFVGFVDIYDQIKILIQKFAASQILNKKFSLLYSENVFRKFTETAFSIENTLTCIIENNRVKFQSQYNLRSIINMKDIYKEATNQEVKELGLA